MENQMLLMLAVVVPTLAPTIVVALALVVVASAVTYLPRALQAILNVAA